MGRQSNRIHLTPLALTGLAYRAVAAWNMEGHATLGDAVEWAVNQHEMARSGYIVLDDWYTIQSLATDLNVRFREEAAALTAGTTAEDSQ